MSIIYDNGEKIYKISFEMKTEKESFIVTTVKRKKLRKIPSYPPDKPNPSESDQPPEPPQNQDERR